MAEAQWRQCVIDQEHLNLLSIFYLVSAILTGLYSLFGLLYAAMGVAMLSMMKHLPATAVRNPSAPPPEMPAEMVWIFVFFGGAFFVGMVVFGALKFMVSQRLKQHRGRTLCLVIGGLSCLEMPYGTALGIFTFVVLSRPSVVALFDQSSQYGEQLPIPEA